MNNFSFHIEQNLFNNEKYFEILLLQIQNIISNYLLFSVLISFSAHFSL